MSAVNNSTSRFDIPKVTEASKEESSPNNENPKACSVVLQGCIHGELSLAYQSFINAKRNENNNLLNNNSKNQQVEYTDDILLWCGDVQSVRTATDLSSLTTPPKYRRLGEFTEYFTRQKIAPVLTLFVGGNHEAALLLRNLCFGGWVAPSIYFVGLCGVVEWKGLTIGGYSGIYKPYDFRKGYSEGVDFQNRSMYHTRLHEMDSILQMPEGCIDVMISHDWPTSVAKKGNVKKLIRDKPFFKSDIENNQLGNPYANNLINKFRPQLWSSAHLHVSYDATFDSGPIKNGEHITRFQALDKGRGRGMATKIFKLVPKNEINKNEINKNKINKNKINKNCEIEDNFSSECEIELEFEFSPNEEIEIFESNAKKQKTGDKKLEENKIYSNYFCYNLNWLLISRLKYSPENNKSSFESVSVENFIPEIKSIISNYDQLMNTSHLFSIFGENDNNTQKINFENIRLPIPNETVLPPANPTASRNFFWRLLFGHNLTDDDCRNKFDMKLFCGQIPPSSDIIINSIDHFSHQVESSQDQQNKNDQSQNSSECGPIPPPPPPPSLV